MKKPFCGHCGGQHPGFCPYLPHPSRREAMKTEPAIYSVAEYEDGWYVEKPDPIAPLHDCKFVQVAGPYKTERSAERKCAALIKGKL
jgi:hypothetical protein